MDDTLPVSEARNRLSDLVNDVATTHSHYTITRNGVPTAVLLSADEWEEMSETMFWMSQPNILEDLEAGDAEIARGEGISIADVRAELVKRHGQI